MPVTIALTLFWLSSGSPVVDARSKADEPRVRRPVALATSPDGSRLFVANRRSGSVSAVDPKEGRVLREHDVAGGLADLAARPDGRLVAVDREGDALLVLEVREGTIEVVARCPVAPDPVSVIVSPDGSRCVVASTASRRLSVIEFRDVDARLARSIPLPFPPRLMAWLDPGSSLVAADAYGGRIALVDPRLDAPISTRSIPSHNIRGLARTPDGRSLVVAHQSLNTLATSSFEDIHWGSLVGNHLRTLPLSGVLDPGADLLRGSKVVDLGGTGRAAGDPGAIAFDARGRMVVALSGVHEVALFADLRANPARRIPVGLGPSAVRPSPDGAVVYVADSFDDSITVLDVESGAKVRTIALGPRPEPTSVDRGERLFADARLSHDGWMSCQSCHTDGRSNALTVDTLSDGGFGAPKRVTSLLGVGSTPPWTWLGSTTRLEDQVRKSVETTMRGRTPTPAQVDDLTAYLRSLPPPRPARKPVDDRAVERGRAIFEKRKCASCHVPPEYTSEGTFDVGLVDEVGHRTFNPPSLRGVGDRGPYLHDGRAVTLPDVFLDHGHPKDSAWSRDEAEDLAALLETL